MSIAHDLDLSRLTAERDALRAAADAMLVELEYLWESATHAARTRRAIDQYRALIAALEGEP